MTIEVTHEGRVTLIGINRPQQRNMIDRATAQQLSQAFAEFEHRSDTDIAILYGKGDDFCFGLDMNAATQGKAPNRIRPDGDSPIGPTRMQLSKPVIAALSGCSFSGGLELAIWADIRIAASDARFCLKARHTGMPLIDGGTVRLPRLIGTGRALDLILTGREIDAEEALSMGLINRIVNADELLVEARKMAKQITAFPQDALRQDRLSTYEQAALSMDAALLNEYERGYLSICSTETDQTEEYADSNHWKTAVRKSFS